MRVLGGTMNSVTEMRNPESKGIDERPIIEILEIINNEDAKIANVIQAEIPKIEQVVNKIIYALNNNGNLYLVGAGTSGRLCVLEAAEIPPTFGLPRERIQAFIAGGKKACFRSFETAEDDASKGALLIENYKIKESDIVLGVTASGTTPFVLGAIEKAKQYGAKTIGLSCNKKCLLSEIADITIEIATGPEVVAGSTRMKAGTAQKMVLNMITTTAMIKLGLVYDGYMVGVQAINDKLRVRSKRIITDLTQVSMEEAEKVLKISDWDVRIALILILTNLNKKEALLKLKNQTLREILTDTIRELYGR
jgi:N-acetylmuramic acid 6-phosphate etherase